VKGDIGTVEKLGGMTPEQLEALEGVDEDAVNRIMQAINGYYGQDYAEQPASETQEAEPEAEPEPVAEPEEPGDNSPNSIENTTESASDTMNEPVESVAVSEGEPAEGIEGDTEPVSAPEAHEPQAGR
jgi:N utilization substance protein A